MAKQAIEMLYALKVEAKSRKTLLLIHESPVRSAKQSIPTACMNCMQLLLHRCVELIGLWSNLAHDKQGQGSWAVLESKNSTCEITEN